jgi:hypothetical protein
MHKIEIKHRKKILLIRLNGFQSSDRELFVSDIEKAATDLPLGFSCILILSKYTKVSGKELQDVENLLYAYGLETILYVGGHHFSFFRHKESFNPLHIRIDQVNTVEEAEEMLASQEGQPNGGLRYG